MLSYEWMQGGESERKLKGLCVQGKTLGEEETNVQSLEGPEELKVKNGSSLW